MRVGDSFSSWQEFENKLKEYRDSTFQPLFNLKCAKTIEYVNEKITPKMQKLKDELKYFSVVICCLHYGSYESKATEVSFQVKLKFLINFKLL